MEEIEEGGEAEVNIGGRSFTVKKQFLEDIAKVKMHEHIHRLKKPILVMHSPQDETVEVINAREIYEAAMHPKSFISLDGADHLLTNDDDSHYVGNVVSNWALRYLNLPEEKNLRSDHQVLAHLGEEGYTTDILSGNHHLKADEPEEVGGKNFGPSPYDLLLSALGAFTAMTLRMYSQRKDWGLKEIEVHMNHEKDYASDSEHTEKKQAKIDIITRTISLSGELNQQQKDKLLEIANKCPVHKTLHNEVKINSSLF